MILINAQLIINHVLIFGESMKQIILNVLTHVIIIDILYIQEKIKINVLIIVNHILTH